MPSRDVNAATRLAEACWRRDKEINVPAECSHTTLYSLIHSLLKLSLVETHPLPLKYRMKMKPLCWVFSEENE